MVWLDLDFYDQINTIKVMTSRSVKLRTFFMGRFSPLSGWPVLCAQAVASNWQLTFFYQWKERLERKKVGKERKKRNTRKKARNRKKERMNEWERKKKMKERKKERKKEKREKRRSDKNQHLAFISYSRLLISTRAIPCCEQHARGDKQPCYCYAKCV